MWRRDLPVLRNADHPVFFRDDRRRGHNLLESLDFTQQARLPSLRTRLDLGRHGGAVWCTDLRLPAPVSGKHNPPRFPHARASVEKLLHVPVRENRYGVVTSVRGTTKSADKHLAAHRLSPFSHTHFISGQKIKTSVLSRWSKFQSKSFVFEGSLGNI